MQTVSQVYYLTFMCGSTCFGHLPDPSPGAYDCTRSLWFYRWQEAVGALLVVVCQTMINKAPAASLQR